MNAHQPGDDNTVHSGDDHNTVDEHADTRRDESTPPELIEPEPVAADATPLPLDDYSDVPEVRDAVNAREASEHEAPAARAVTEPDSVATDATAEHDGTATSAAAVAAPVAADSSWPNYGAPAPVATHGAPAPVTTHEAPSQPAPQNVVYVTAPQSPKRKNNRGFGILMSVLATLAFALLFMVLMVIVYSTINGGVLFGFLGETAFYIPVLFFLVGMILLAAIINRGGWWSWVIGSVVVALIVYFGTIGAFLLNSGVVLETPDGAAAMFRSGLSDPLPIFAALLAREVALWTGAIIAARGRKVKVRNSEAIDAYQREKAETNAR